LQAANTHKETTDSIRSMNRQTDRWHPSTPAASAKPKYIGAGFGQGAVHKTVTFDYAMWTETVCQRADALAGLVARDKNIKSARIWTDGKVSDRLKAELNQRAIGYESLPVVNS
jgi:hypothetical protein